MNKIIIALCAFLAVAYAKDQVDNYIKLNRDQYLRVVNGYDSKLNFFRQHYPGRVEAISIQKEMVVASIVQTEERLTPMTLINDFTKQCVTKYQGRVAGVKQTKDDLEVCEIVATTELNELLKTTISIRNALANDIVNVFDREVDNCGKKAPDQYTSCVSNVISKTNKFVHANKKDFEYALEAAECKAKANVKQLVDCYYSVYSDVLTVLGQIDALINKCLIGEDQCKPCEKYTCAEATDVYGRYDNQSIANPLYGRVDNPKCLMLNVH